MADKRQVSGLPRAGLIISDQLRCLLRKFRILLHGLPADAEHIRRVRDLKLPARRGAAEPLHLHQSGQQVLVDVPEPPSLAALPDRFQYRLLPGPSTGFNRSRCPGAACAAYASAPSVRHYRVCRGALGAFTERANFGTTRFFHFAPPLPTLGFRDRGFFAGAALTCLDFSTCARNRSSPTDNCRFVRLGAVTA